MTTRLDIEKEVWVFRAGDMCIGRATDGCKKCMLQWLHDMFGWSHLYDDAVSAFHWASDETGVPYPTLDIHEGRVTPQEAANTANLATAKMGYVHGNPMAGHEALKETAG